MTTLLLSHLLIDRHWAEWKAVLAPLGHPVTGSGFGISTSRCWTLVSEREFVLRRHFLPLKTPVSEKREITRIWRILVLLFCFFKSFIKLL